jgi:hypothetical protein
MKEKRKISTEMMLLILIFLFVILTYVVSLTGGQISHRIVMQKDWDIMIAGENYHAVDLNQFVLRPQDRGEKVILTKQLPQEYISDPLLVFHVKHSTIQVMIDGEEIYAYGQEYIYDVYQLNDEAIFLYTPHASFVKSGYSQPSIFGEEFTYVEYVVSEGIDFSGIPDDYKEEATLLANFDTSVKLEDVIETEPTDIKVSEEAIEECNEIRFKYKNYSDVFALFYIYGVDGDYYLDICDYNFEDNTANHQWYKIKPEYVDLLTSAM